MQEKFSTVQRKEHVGPKAYNQCVLMLKAPILFRSSKEVKYFRQSATLTAFGNPVFNKPIESIAAILAVFKRAVGDRLHQENMKLLKFYLILLNPLN